MDGDQGGYTQCDEHLLQLSIRLSVEQHGAEHSRDQRLHPVVQNFQVYRLHPPHEAYLRRQ